MTNSNSKKGFTTIQEVLKKFEVNDDKYVSREFQLYGYNLAQELEDPKNVSLYIKLAKDLPRGLMETARSFVKDAQNVKSKPALFMWKLTQMKKGLKIQTNE